MDAEKTWNDEDFVGKRDKNWDIVGIFMGFIKGSNEI